MSAKRELTEVERIEKADWVLSKVGCAPAQIFCPVYKASGGGYHLDPYKVERLLKKRGQLRHRDNESISNAVTRAYGADVAQAMYALI